MTIDKHEQDYEDLDKKVDKHIVEVEQNIDKKFLQHTEGNGFLFKKQLI